MSKHRSPRRRHAGRQHVPRRRVVAVAGSALLLSGAAVVTAPASSAAGPAADITWSQFIDRDFSSARIVVAGPDGRGLREVSSPASGVVDLDPAWSPDRRTIAFERDLPDRSELVTVGADGSDEHVVDVGCSAPCDFVLTPTWSPDGSRLVFTLVYGPYDDQSGDATSAVLWSAQTDGSDLQRLSPPGIDPRYEDYRARYSSDGSYLVFLRVDNATRESAVFRMEADGSGVRQLTPWDLRADTQDLSQATSGPTKDLVVFESYGHGGPPPGAVEDIMTVPATCPTVSECTEQIRNVTRNGDGPKGSNNPVWSADGSRVAFSEYVHPAKANAVRFADVLTMDPDGGARRRVSHSPTWDFRPDW